MLQKDSKIRIYKCSDEENINKNISFSEIKTPKREALLLSPSALIQIGASPDSKRYDSIRKIDFGNEERKIHPSKRKLDFLK